MKKVSNIGILILLVVFALFYFITDYILARRDNREVIIENIAVKPIVPSDEQGKKTIEKLYDKARILYDVVNNKFKVNQEEIITVGEINYKKITNFDEVMRDIFTDNGIKKYITDLGDYFAVIDDNYYLAGNLVSYQTYYFRGNETTIHILNTKEDEINGIIYEKWTSNNKNTLATIKIVKVDNKWLIDDISIIAV